MIRFTNAAAENRDTAHILGLACADPECEETEACRAAREADHEEAELFTDPPKFITVHSAMTGKVRYIPVITNNNPGA